MSVTYDFSFLDSIPSGTTDFSYSSGPSSAPADFSSSVAANNAASGYDFMQSQASGGGYDMDALMSGGTPSGDEMGRIAVEQANAADAGGYAGFGDIASGQENLFMKLLSGGGETIKKLGEWAKANPKLAEAALNTGGGLLAQMVKQSDMDKQIKAAKEIRETDNQYQKDAEDRQMRRAAHGAVKKESWGKTGLLDAAMQQKGAK